MFRFADLARASRLLLFCALAIPLGSCGKSEPAPDPLKAQRNAVQKARDLNDVVDKAADTTRAKIGDVETK
jgi:hypothetical protein